MADQDLRVRIAADTKSLRNELDRAAHASRTASGKMKRDFKSSAAQVDQMRLKTIALRGALVALATVAVFGNLMKNALEYADAIGKTADKVGLTTDALQELRFAADQTGVGANTLDMAMQRFSRRLGEAAQGTGELLPVLQQYNIAVKDSAGNTRSVEAVLNDYADALERVKDPQEQLRIAFKGFDSEGAALINMLKNGSIGLEELRKKAREVGAVMRGDLIRSAEETKSNFDALSAAIRTQLYSAVMSVAPTLNSIFEKLAIALPDIIAEVERFAAAMGLIDGVSLQTELRGLNAEAEGIKQHLSDLAALRVEITRGVSGAMLGTVTHDIDKEIAQLEIRAADIVARQAELQRQLDGERILLDEKLKAYGSTGSGPPVLSKSDQDAAAAAINKVKESIADLQFELSLIGSSDFDKALAQKLRALGIEFEILEKGVVSSTDARGQQITELLRKLDEEKQKTEATAKAIQRRDALLEQSKSTHDRYIESLQEAQELYRAELLTKEELVRIQNQLREAYEKTQEKAKESETALERFGKEARDTQAMVQDLAVDGLRSLEDALLDITDGSRSAKEAFSDMARSILRDMQRIMIRKTITGPLSDMLGGVLDGMFGGIGGGISGSLASAAGSVASPGTSFAPFRAAGGGMRAGQAATVGERGQELFIPDVAGRVVRNGAAAAGGGGAVTNVTMNISNPTRDMVPMLVEQVRSLGAQVRVMDRGFEDRANNAVVRRRQRDGAKWAR